MSISARKEIVEDFPRGDVEVTLRDALEQIVERTALLSGDCQPGQEIDSLSVVEILCDIDELVGFEIKQKVVRAGGYESVDDALIHMIPEIEALWAKKKGRTYEPTR